MNNLTQIAAGLSALLNFIPGWKTHGTKILGAVGIAIGVLTALKPDQVLAMLGSSYGPGATVAIAGLVTFLRGFQNSATAAQSVDKQSGFARVSALATLAAGAVVACASLGLPSSLTFNGKLDAAYTAETQVLQTTLALGQAGKITKADAANIEAQADNVKAALDIARELHATDAAGGSSKLDAAVAALTALQTYLTQRGT